MLWGARTPGNLTSASLQDNPRRSGPFDTQGAHRITSRGDQGHRGGLWSMRRGGVRTTSFKNEGRKGGLRGVF